jgi:hypothetical protein
MICARLVTTPGLDSTFEDPLSSMRRIRTNRGLNTCETGGKLPNDKAPGTTTPGSLGDYEHCTGVGEEAGEAYDLQ